MCVCVCLYVYAIMLYVSRLPRVDLKPQIFT